MVGAVNLKKTNRRDTRRKR